MNSFLSKPLRFIQDEAVAYATKTLANIAQLVDNKKIVKIQFPCPTSCFTWLRRYVPSLTALKPSPSTLFSTTIHSQIIHILRWRLYSNRHLFLRRLDSQPYTFK